MKNLIRLRFLLKSAFGKAFTQFDHYLAKALLGDNILGNEPDFVHIVYGHASDGIEVTDILPEVWADFRFSLKESKS